MSYIRLSADFHKEMTKHSHSESVFTWIIHFTSVRKQEETEMVKGMSINY